MRPLPPLSVSAPFYEYLKLQLHRSDKLQLSLSSKSNFSSHYLASQTSALTISLVLTKAYAELVYKNNRNKLKTKGGDEKENFGIGSVRQVLAGSGKTESFFY